MLMVTVSLKTTTPETVTHTSGADQTTFMDITQTVHQYRQTAINVCIANQSNYSQVECHEIVMSDVTELSGIIAEHGSWKVWCSNLKISKVTCNRLQHAGQHYSENVLEVAEAYLNEMKDPCWEDIVRVLCKTMKKNNPAQKVAKRHNVNYVCLCAPA